MHISSVMVFALTSSTPRKMAGNPMELLTWLGKSDLPVANTLHPCSLASQGQISGMGLAVAKMTGSSAMRSTYSGGMVPGPGLDAAMTMSAPSNASFIPPVFPAPLVFSQISHFCLNPAATSSLDWFRIPLESHMHMFLGLNPVASRSLAMAMDAAPAPMTVMCASSSFFPTSFIALMAPATSTVAVPCWSSCQTGILQSLLSSSRMSKHLGLEMSSRLIPPNEGARSLTVSMIFSGSLVSRQMGTQSTPPRYLKSIAFPSMTGMAASGPMSPSPSTRVPSDTTATVFHFQVCSYTISGFLAMSLQGSATPGEYQMAKSSNPL